jgi:O-antigen/teichoic acid export membrane protein
VLLLLVWLGAIVTGVFAQPLTPEAAAPARVTCIVLGVRVLLTFIGSVYSGLLCGYDRYDLVNAVLFSGTVIRFIVTPLLLATGADPLITMAVIAASVCALEAIVLAVIAHRRVGDLSVRPVWPERQERGRLYGFGLQAVFVVLAIKIISYTNTTVVGITLGAASVALIALPLQLVEYSRLAVGGFVEVLLPRVERLSSRGDRDGLRATYLQSTRVACFMAGWLVALLIGLGPSFLTRWVGPEYGAPAQWVLVYLGLAMFGHVLSAQMPLPFYQAMHTLFVPAVVLLTEAAVNFGLGLWLAPQFGLVGMALATAIPAVGIGLLVLPPYLCRRLDLSVIEWLRQSVVPGTLMLACGLVIQYGIGLLIGGDSYTSIAIRSVSTLPVAAVVVGLTFPAGERQAIWVRTRRLLMELQPGGTG